MKTRPRLGETRSVSLNANTPPAEPFPRPDRVPDFGCDPSVLPPTDILPVVTSTTKSESQNRQCMPNSSEITPLPVEERETYVCFLHIAAIGIQVLSPDRTVTEDNHQYIPFGITRALDLHKNIVLPIQLFQLHNSSAYEADNCSFVFIS